MLLATIREAPYWHLGGRSSDVDDAYHAFRRDGDGFMLSSEPSSHFCISLTVLKSVREKQKFIWMIKLESEF